MSRRSVAVDAGDTVSQPIGLLAFALLGQPGVLLLDEPTAGIEAVGTAGRPLRVSAADLTPAPEPACSSDGSCQEDQCGRLWHLARSEVRHRKLK